jgi:L-2-hydroxyglutarate oxidase LhgO
MSTAIDNPDADLEAVDCVVIGAGVVGLACARAMALAGRQVLILEAEAAFGTGASSRNSEVIHAGLYYPPGSLKARLCVRGRHLLYGYCRERGIAHRQCGKLVVATNETQLAALEALHAQALANGVDDVRFIEADAARTMEPALACVAALHSPSTGIVDSHGLMLSLLGDAENAGAMLVLKTPVLGGDHAGERIVLSCGGETPMRLAANTVINASGLFSTLLAGHLPRLQPARLPVTHFAKGSYFSLGGRAPFSRLIYPVPEPGGLGVHLTLDLQGRGRFGPNVEWLDDPTGEVSPQPAAVTLDYAVNPMRTQDFESEIRRYWPSLPSDSLAPDYAGIRAKIAGPGEQAADFVIEDAHTHGTAGLINLLGIESPGLTASLAIAEEVVTRLQKG